MSSNHRIYLDTSVYLAILLGESAAKRIQSKMKGKILCSSTLLVIETERNLIRLTRERVLQVSEYEEAMDQLERDVEFFILKDLTLDLCLKGSFPAIRTPRSSDLVHLRTAKWFEENGGLEAFISLDRPQVEAAKELGLKATLGV